MKTKDKLKGCFMHNSDDWKTPNEIYHYFIVKHEYIDPCPYKAKFNGLEKNYTNKKIYINPPYSQIEKWVDWAIKQMKNDCKVVMLIPSRTDTKYFHKLLEYKPLIKAFKGRLKFENEEGKQQSAPFPSLLIYLEKNKYTATTLITTEKKAWEI